MNLKENMGKVDRIQEDLEAKLMKTFQEQFNTWRRNLLLSLWGIQATLHVSDNSLCFFAYYLTNNTFEYILLLQLIVM